MAQDDARVRDYLDDRLQTAADLDAVDSLLEDVRKQQILLREQLATARQEHATSAERQKDHDSALSEKHTGFNDKQRDIDRTLMIITQSDSTEDAVARFHDVMEDLRRLDVATRYIELATEVDNLSASIHRDAKVDIDRAISGYVRLKDLAIQAQSLQEVAEGAAPHLIDHIANSTGSVRKLVVDRIGTDMTDILKRIGWPKTSATVPKSYQQEWHNCVDRLLDLQRPELQQTVLPKGTSFKKSEPEILAPMEVLVRPLAMRFQYHFSGDRMTNRLDKPEYFFNHVLDLIDDYLGFVQDTMQTALLRHFGKTDLALIPAYIDISTAWINALLPTLRKRLQNILPEVAKQASLFSNLVHETMAFDVKLQEDWDYCPLSPAIPYRGLSHFVLSDLGYFPAWFAIERDFALARYESIISDRSTGELEFHGVDADSTKPTKAAIRVNDLLETITDRYRSLAPFHQKMKFLIDIQIAIFDRFHSRLHEGLEAYLTRTSTVARTVHGMSAGDDGDISGTKGLDRLCRVYGSAEYLEKAMQDWSEDLFFLDLWDELQSRAQSNSHVKGDLSIRDMTSRTSAGIDVNQHEIRGALFDETAGAYHRLRVRSEQVIIDTVTYELRTSWRPYARVNTWASMSGTGSKPTLTAELDGTVRLLDEYLGFLSRAIGTTSIRRTAGPIFQSLYNLIWDTVVLRHTFSTAGALQLRSDVDGLERVMLRHLDRGIATGIAGKVREGLGLLSLPVKGEIPEHGNPQTPSSAIERHDLGLWEVERRLFADNESAREVLDELNISRISESEAREVLKKRIEIAS